jgi:hypothetical protein
MTFYKIGLVTFSFAIFLILPITFGSRIFFVNHIDDIFVYFYLIVGLIVLSLIFFMVGFSKRKKNS